MADVVDAGVPTIRIPPASDPSMLDVLRQAMLENSVDLLIPTVSEELPILAAAEATFGSNTQIVVSGAGPVNLAHDKLLTARRLAANAVAVPRFASPSNLDDLDAAFQLLGRPFVVKPRISRGGRGVTVVRSQSDLAWPGTDDGWILQEFAPGVEYGPVVYRAPDGYGRDAVIVLEKTGLAAGEVGNATGVRRLPAGEADDVAAVALAAVRTLDLVGPVDVDVRRMADGLPVILEINARFGANSAAAPELLDYVLEAFNRQRLRAA